MTALAMAAGTAGLPEPELVLAVAVPVVTGAAAGVAAEVTGAAADVMADVIEVADPEVAAWACRENTSRMVRIPAAKIAPCTAR